MPKMYSYGKQVVEQDDIDAVIRVLQSDWLTQGPAVTQFESALCEKFGCQHAAVVSNGTAALHLAALALGWKPGDVVISAPITFLASTNCAVYTGATPDFVDVDPCFYTIDLDQLEQKIQRYKRAGKHIKAVVAVDFAGQPCDWQTLRDLADRYEFQLVDDACHALGAKYRGEHVCAATYADAVICSFHPVKHITSGEGGAVLTNDAELDARIKMFRSHGATRDGALMEKNEGPWYYEMIELGYNYRITDLQCALGVNQLEKLDRFLARRREIAAFYDDAFSQAKYFTTPAVDEDVAHAYHIYPLQIDFEALGINKAEFFGQLRETGIIGQVHYIPVHLQPYYRDTFGFKSGDFPVAEAFYKNEISIPIYPRLEMEDLQYICQKLYSYTAQSS